MTSNLERLFILHSVTTMHEGMRLLALDEHYQDGKLQTAWVDVTSWTISQAKNWLGY